MVSGLSETVSGAQMVSAASGPCAKGGGFSSTAGVFFASAGAANTSAEQSPSTAGDLIK